MKTQDSLNRSSSPQRSLEIFIWIAAILVFIIFLIGSSASANNSQAPLDIKKTNYTSSATQNLTDQFPLSKFKSLQNDAFNFG